MCHDEEQRAELARVGGRIREAILDFCRNVLLGTGNFQVSELARHVEEFTGMVAPASPDRVLRDLRQCGYLHYVVTSRSRSRYRLSWVIQPGDRPIPVIRRRTNNYQGCWYFVAPNRVARGPFYLRDTAVQLATGHAAEAMTDSNSYLLLHVDPFGRMTVSRLPIGETNAPA